MHGSISRATIEMCLFVLAFQQNSEHPLIALANRDEFYARPTRAADWWPESSDILGGKDTQAGGTWLALHRNGRFATVTNFRDAKVARPGLLSRGHLVTDFLTSTLSPGNYLDQIDGDSYAGFNLLVGDRRSLAYLSNRGGGLRELEPGIYGLSNATLDTPWDKVIRSKAALADLTERNTVDETLLLDILRDQSRSPETEAESNHLPLETAHALTAPFITLPDYGTRCSSVVIQTKSGETRFLERRFDAGGIVSGESSYSFSV